MRLRLLSGVLGRLLVIIGLSLLVPMALALGYGDGDAPALGLAALLTVALGSVGILLGRPLRGQAINHREGFAIVTLGWLLASAVGALPYSFYAHGLGLGRGLPDRCAAAAPPPAEGGPGQAAASSAAASAASAASAAPATEERPLGAEFCDFTNAYFETMSGFSTTGATVITRGLWPAPDRHDGLPHGLLFWRALTHWLGGMGIILLSLAILPLLGVAGMQLYRAEVPGTTKDKIAPRLSQTAKLLWSVYLLLTVAQILLTLLGGVDPFVATTHAFATLATGGFSVLAKSVEGFSSPYIEYVTTVFMLLAGSSFALHFWALRGRLAAYVRDVEWRAFIGCFAVASLAVGLALRVEGVAQGSEPAFRLAIFQVASILTTTGFFTTDFEAWSISAPFAPCVLFLLMFAGGCAGSTGGGIKWVRLAVGAKVGYRELFRLVHPRAIFPIQLGGRTVDQDVRRSVFGFLVLYIACFAAGSLLLAADGSDLVTAMTACATCLGNVGPGLGQVGPYDSFLWMSPLSKWICILLMLVGRLEIYTVLVLLLPSAWLRR